jgi:carbamoyl-phosphate synthase small subunit
MESEKIQAAGAIVRSLPPSPRNWRKEKSIVAWVTESQMPILTGVNTRALTIHIRSRGAMRAGIFTNAVPSDDALRMVKDLPSMQGADLAKDVTCMDVYKYENENLNERWHPVTGDKNNCRVAVLDFGIKRNILNELYIRGCDVTVYPGNTGSRQILDKEYDGLFISNGPGDPAAVTYGIDTVRDLIDNIPVFGICLGHQILSLAAGFQTYKLPFGHRGANHPVMNNFKGTVEISSQNHGFAVNPENSPVGWRITHTNLNDGTVEGLEHEELPLFSIQYHPEASPGPHEGKIYFDRFIEEMINAKK